MWAHVRGFKKWLVLDPKKPHEVNCKFCKRSMGARYNTLVFHAKSQNHLTLSGLKMPSDQDLRIPLKVEIKEERNKARAVLKLVGLCAEINQPFSTLVKVVNTFKSISKESTVQNIRLGRTKARNILTNVIGKCAKSSLDNFLRNHKFSICVDESTDVSKDKCLAIVVRYIDIEVKKIQSKLWTMIPVLEEGKEAKAGSERLFRCIRDSFVECNIPLDNIVGCCFDGCQTMIGKKSGLKMRLQDAIPGLVCVQCPAHSTHLCAQHAMKRLPPELASFFSNVYSLINSANKLHDFSEIQKEQLLRDLGFPLRKLLKMSNTRWLVLENCTNRVIEQWPVIIQCAEKLSLKGDSTAKEVLTLMQKPDFKLYFYLLQKTLYELNSLNTLFQRRDIVLDVAREAIDKAYKNIVSCILKRDYVNKTPAEHIDVFDTENYLRFAEFELGEKIRNTLLQNGDCTGDFCKKAFNYTIALSLQMRQRFDNFVHPVYNLTECLKIENALSTSFRSTKPTAFKKLMELYKKVVGENQQELQTQWDSLPSINMTTEIIAQKTIEEFWIFILNLEVGGKSKPYSLLAQFVLDVLTTPHANADTERIFSDVNNCKTKHRNKMSVTTVDASMRGRQLIKSESNFEPTKEILDIVLNVKFYTYKRKKNHQMLFLVYKMYKFK